MELDLSQLSPWACELADKFDVAVHLLGAAAAATDVGRQHRALLAAIDVHEAVAAVQPPAAPHSSGGRESLEIQQLAILLQFAT